MLFLSCCAVLAIVALYPETPIGNVLKRFLVDLPAEKLARLTPAAILFLILLIAVTVAATLYDRSAGARVAAQAPETLSWFFAFDIGTYIDVIAIAWLAAATLRLRVVYQRLRSAFSRVWRLAVDRAGALAGRVAARRRSPRRRPSARPPTSSDEEGWSAAGLAFA